LALNQGIEKPVSQYTTISFRGAFDCRESKISRETKGLVSKNIKAIPVTGRGGL
jgi:hypothetical protein